MKIVKNTAVTLVTVAVMATMANANTISILATDGSVGGSAAVYTLDTTTGVATFAASAADPASTQTQFSPNALGVSGADYFYSTFNVSGDETFYRNTTALLSLAAANNAIAAADAVGSNYYYVDRDGRLVTVSSIFGAPSAGIPGPQIGGFSGATLGDLAIDGTTGYLSHGSSLSTLDITNPAAGFTQTISSRRYVGLGFDGSNLYGVFRNGASDFDLYLINTSTLASTLVAGITGVPEGWEITDASRALVPEPSTIALAGLGLPMTVGMLWVNRRRRRLNAA